MRYKEVSVIGQSNTNQDHKPDRRDPRGTTLSLCMTADSIVFRFFRTHHRRERQNNGKENRNADQETDRYASLRSDPFKIYETVHLV